MVRFRRKSCLARHRLAVPAGEGTNCELTCETGGTSRPSAPATGHPQQASVGSKTRSASACPSLPQSVLDGKGAAPWRSRCTPAIWTSQPHSARSAVEKAQHLERFLEGTQKAEIVFSRDHAARDDGYVTCEISVVAHGRVVRVRSSGHLASTALETAIAKETQRLHADAGPSRATLTASSRRGEPATDGACGLKNLPSPDPPRAVIVGPTGTGKTALALDLARLAPERYELVSVDAMAVYRDLDIGTAKPTPAERAAAPWHLIDIVDPSEEFSVAAFQAEARRVLSGIDARGHLALLVGGTGLYHRAVVDGLEIPGRFPREAAELEQLADRPGGLAELFGRLSELDPVAASRVEPGNRRRIVRALEVTLGSGRPFSSFGPGLLSYRSTSSISRRARARPLRARPAACRAVRGPARPGLPR